ncbi:hypothetical protein EON77_05240, partial [bacterium]
LERELESEGVKVNIVGVNSTDAVADQAELTSRASIPFLQDATNANGTSRDTVWQLLGGKKDDLYVYNAKGELTAHLRPSGTVKIDLTTGEGYDTVKAAIEAAK